MTPEVSPDGSSTTSITPIAGCSTPHSPRFIASVIAEDASRRKPTPSMPAVDAAFVGNGFTRWVDGQYAFDRPELGLSNWQGGRLFARGGVLSGDGVYTVRTRMRQRDAAVHR